jgi:histidinol-phosphate aminotransferase
VGVKVYPSEANFLLFRIENATEIFEALKQRGILIKNLNGGQPKLRNCLRVTIGTAEENIKFMSALHAIL